jgi:hypothetical protein
MLYDGEWYPGRWWSVVYAQERPGGIRANVWCGTSNEQEARAALARCPGGGVLLRQYVRSESEYREVDRS